MIRRLAKAILLNVHMSSKPPPLPRVCHLCRRPPKERAGDLCAKHDLVLIDPAEHKKDPVDPFLGRTVGGRYPIVGIVGSGGMGRVYRAVQQPVGREVALKVIRNTGDDRLQVQGRFEREARVGARLRHAPRARTVGSCDQTECHNCSFD